MPNDIAIGIEFDQTEVRTRCRHGSSAEIHAAREAEGEDQIARCIDVEAATVDRSGHRFYGRRAASSGRLVNGQATTQSDRIHLARRPVRHGHGDICWNSRDFTRTSGLGSHEHRTKLVNAVSKVGPVAEVITRLGNVDGLSGTISGHGRRESIAKIAYATELRYFLVECVVTVRTRLVKGAPEGMVCPIGTIPLGWVWHARGRKVSLELRWRLVDIGRCAAEGHGTAVGGHDFLEGHDGIRTSPIRRHLPNGAPHEPRIGGWCDGANESVADATDAFATRYTGLAGVFDTSAITITHVRASRRSIRIALPGGNGRTCTNRSGQMTSHARPGARGIATNAIDAMLGSALIVGRTRRAIGKKDRARARAVAFAKWAFVIGVGVRSHLTALAIRPAALFRCGARLAGARTRGIATDAIDAKSG